MQNIQNVYVLLGLAMEREHRLRGATRAVRTEHPGYRVRRRLGEWLERLGAWVATEPSASETATLGAR